MVVYRPVDPCPLLPRLEHTPGHHQLRQSTKELLCVGWKLFCLPSPSHLCFVYGSDRKYIQDSSKDICMQVDHGWHMAWLGSIRKGQTRKRKKKATHACVVWMRCMCADNRLSPVSLFPSLFWPFFSSPFAPPFISLRLFFSLLSCLPSFIPSIHSSPPLSLSPLSSSSSYFLLLLLLVLLISSPGSSSHHIWTTNYLLGSSIGKVINTSQERIPFCVVLCWRYFLVICFAWTWFYTFLLVLVTYCSYPLSLFLCPSMPNWSHFTHPGFHGVVVSIFVRFAFFYDLLVWAIVVVVPYCCAFIVAHSSLQEQGR